MYLGQRHGAFDATEVFTHQYYLPLPQLYETTRPSPPEGETEECHEVNGIETAEDKNETRAGICISPERIGWKPAIEDAGNNKGSAAGKGGRL